MSKPRKVIVSRSRKVHTYAELWNASHWLLKSGIQNEEGSAWQFLSSAITTAFAFEAYLNHVGAASFNCWSALDRIPILSKFDLLCEKLAVHFPKGPGAGPLQTITKLFAFRNTLAHGRSQEIRAKPMVRTTENYKGALRERLLTDWERLVRTETFAAMARRDVELVMRKLHDARPQPKEPLFSLGIGHSGVSLIEEP
jgi:hypothetical protein